MFKRDVSGFRTYFVVPPYSFQYIKIKAPTNVDASLIYINLK